MKVTNVFYSLSGEGIHAGIPAVFIRLSGCNLNCTYCDTQYAQSEYEEQTVREVLQRVKSFRQKGWVLVTGGEPLLQADSLQGLVDLLKFRGYLIELETNGSFDPPSWFGDVDSWSVDVKCPSSGSAYGSFRAGWLRKLRKRDQLKFVVGTREDLNFVRGFLSNNSLGPALLVSPISGTLLDKKEGVVEEYWNREWLREVAEFCKGQNVRMSLQLHKIIWGNKKGV